VLEGPPTILAFKRAKVEQLVSFLVEATGKVVLPQQTVLNREVTVLNDQPIPREQALDFVILALQQADVAVVETPNLITLRDINEVERQDVPIVGSSTSMLARTDYGTIVEKVFTLRNSTAENIGAIVKESLPDFARVTVDKESNQIAVLGNVGLLQRLERLIASLDTPSSASLQTETYKLRHADAEQIATNIRDLFSASTNRTGNQQQQNPFAQFFGGRGGQQGGNQGGNQGGGRGGNQGGNQPAGGGTTRVTGADGESTSISQNLRVSANTQQNSVTVLAEKPVLDQIRKQIDEFWDKPLPDEAVVPRIYDLKNSDPIKVRDTLEGLFGRGTPGGTGNTQGGNAGSGASSQGVGRLAGQFSFQAIPEAGRLVVVSKSPDNLQVIDKIIEGLDQPQSVGLPTIVELKHASSEELAEQLNTLLSQDGTLAQIQRSASGLSTGSSTSSPFASNATDTTQTNTQNQNNTTTAADQIAFWWQRSRPPTTSRGPSNLIGQIRIVPVWRQNALMVLSPPEYRQSMVQLITDLDRPGRQVLISAVVCEVSRDDALSLGLRWGSGTITPSQTDNSISVGNSVTGTKNDLLNSLFDTSVLNTNVNINALLQALATKNNLSILSEPRIFTADNQEATFFSGQDVPFVNDSQTNTNGDTISQSFDYKAVGIQLRVRPRITPNRDVDLRVNVQLASIAAGESVPGATGAVIIDRRETTTQLIIKDAQTVVISGILRKEETDIERKIPLLGDIPLLGELFKSRDKSRTDAELLIFITPIVVENPEEREKMNAPYKDRLDELRKQLGGKPDGSQIAAPTESPKETPAGETVNR